MRSPVWAKLWRGVAGGFLLLLAQAQAQPVVSLREVAEVPGDRVRLSDLLPEGASHDLEELAEKLDLGRAPQPGSVRVLEDAWLRQRLSAGETVLRSLEIPARILVRRSGRALGREEIGNAVTRFLRRRGLEDSAGPADMEWPMMWTAGPAAPALEVSSATWDGLRQLVEFRLRCSLASACAPFLVRARMAEDTRTVLLRQALWPEVRAAAAPNPTLVEAGQSATLVLERGGLRFSTLVICLGRGALGQQIRARAAQGRRLFYAEVVAAGRLRAVP